MRETIIACAISALLGLMVGGGVVRTYYAPRLELAQARTEALSDDIRTQNRAIDALRTEATKRQERAAVEIASAEAKAQTHERHAAELAALPQPGGDECQAIDALLRKELGK